MRGSRWLLAAAVAGLIHGAASAFWAVGGTWLVDTVGAWAVQWRDNQPTTAAWTLGLIALAKAALAVSPLVITPERSRLIDIARPVWWLAAVGLIVYGGANMVMAMAALAGMFPNDALDPVALAGHAYLWDPLFALWGVCLFVGLWQSRNRGSFGD